MTGGTMSTMLVQDDEDFHAALRRARAAVDMLAQLRIAVTPARFTVAYSHFAGEINDLCLAMNRLTAHDKVTAQALDEIYEQFFGRYVEESELRSASVRIQRTVAEISEYIDTAGEAAEHYGTVLEGFTGETDGDLPLSGSLTVVLDETRQMAETNRQLERRLQASAQEIVHLREHLARLEREASVDTLTGIANRKSFDMALRAGIVRANREEAPLCLLMIDIDHFKSFNDSHGHILGDQVLKLVARYMTECVKGQDLVARYGGEEFSLLLPRTALDDARKVAENIRRYVASKKVVNRRTGASLGQITLSVGAAEYRPGESGGELVHRADEALYLAKTKGRNQVRTEAELPPDA